MRSLLCAACGETTEVRPCGACGADPLLNGAYALLSVLGHGGAGVTYRARAVDGDGIVAIKELPLRAGLPDKQTQLFRREARVLQQLSHPNIPRYIDDFQAGSGKHRALYLVQAFVDGTDLEQSLQSRRYSATEALELLAELLPVLTYLHELSPPVIHRDLKPRNLIRAADERLFLVDFGAVRDALQDDLGGSTVAGTFGFMAPEQFMGSASPATDLYGLGATAVALLSRKPLNSLLDTDRKLAWEPHVQLPEPIAALLRELLAPDPADRPASARQVSARVAALLENPASEALAVVQAPAPLAIRSPAPPATVGAVILGGSTEIALERVVRGRLRPDQHARVTALIEASLQSPAGRVEILGELYRWATSAETNRMIRISAVDLGDGTTRIQVWERMSGRAGALYGGLVGGLGGGLGGGMSALFAPFGPLAMGAWVAGVTIGAYVLARTLYSRAHRSRRAELEQALDALQHFLETG